MPSSEPRDDHTDRSDGVTSPGTVVPFPTGESSCPVCGQPTPEGHPSVQVHVERVTGSRLPDGLATVLARTGHVSRQARAERAAEEARIDALAGYVAQQVALFLEAMAEASVQPKVAVRVGEGRAARLRGEHRRCFPIRHWRSHAPTMADVPRTRHLYVSADGTLFESPDDPGVAAAHDEVPTVQAIDLQRLLRSMGELDAMRSSERVINGLADLMKDNGVTL